MNEPRATKTDCEYVYERLRADIMSGRIQANERILEREYAEKFGVSRTPVREALRLLERDGLVDFKLKRGVTARALLTRDDVEEIFRLREILQLNFAEDTMNNLSNVELAAMGDCNIACAKALQNQDCRSFFRHYDRFNHLLINGCRRTFVIRLLAYLDSFDPITSVISADAEEGDDVLLIRLSVSTWERRQSAWKEHMAILEALKHRDLEKYKHALHIHIQHSSDACRDGLRQPGSS